uniref:Integrase catalytic domain-containing protein n=1 Tax=Clytia hemisphaerica TaxID=252671 RepID=A0A7M5UYT5_9CNID
MINTESESGCSSQMSQNGVGLEDQPNPNESVDKDAFTNWLINKISRQSSMVSRAHGEKVIAYLREEREHGDESVRVKSKFNAQFRFQVKKRKFRLINVVGLGDILCLPIKDKNKQEHAMLGQHRQVIFKEDMYSVINTAHVNGERHRGYKGTFSKINATYCNIPREVVSKFVSMCKFCQTAHACFVPGSMKNGTKNKQKKKDGNFSKRKEIPLEFLTRCQVDILDMQSFPDVEGQFSYVAHFFDHASKYNVLIPLKRTDSLYVAKKLCRYVFGHFGLPRIIHSNLGRKYVDDLITWILQLWSTDAQILNGNPRFKKFQQLIQQRQKTVMTLIETIRAKQPDLSNWSSWLPGIQYSLNTNQFEADSAPSYYSVFTRRPKVYTYAPSSKDIPREEDVIEESICQEENAMNEVITVSVNELIQNQTNTIIIPQLAETNPTNDTLNPDKQNDGNVQIKDANNASSTTLPATDISTLSAIPLSFGEQQYTLINFGGQTLQIPIVNLGNTSLSLQTITTEESLGQNSTDLESSGVQRTLQLHDSTTLSLSDNTLSLPPDESTLGLQNQDHSHITLNDGPQNTLVLENQETTSLGLENNRTQLTLQSQDHNSLRLVENENTLRLDNEGSDTLGLTNDGSSLGLESEERTDLGLLESEGSLGQNNLGLREDSSVNTMGIDDSGSESSLSLTNNALNLNSQTGEDDSLSISSHLKIQVMNTGQQTGQVQQDGVETGDESCLSIKDGELTSPRFAMTSLEREIDEAVQNEESSY